MKVKTNSNIKNVLIITPSPILGHLFHIIDSYFPQFTFNVADAPDFAYMMFQNGNFDVVIVEPFSLYTNLVDNDMVAVLEEISKVHGVTIVYLSHMPMPEHIANYFDEKIIFPFDKMTLDKNLEKIFLLLEKSGNSKSAGVQAQSAEVQSAEPLD